MTEPTFPLLTQLDSGAPTAPADCSVVTLENAVKWASDGKVGPIKGVPAMLPQSQRSWAAEVRKWAGVTANRGLLFHTETFRAYKSVELAKLFRAAGLQPPVVEFAGNVGWGEVGRRLKAGQAVHLAIDYGVLRNSPVPVNSLTFSGGHSVLLVGFMREHYHQHTWYGDPLADGRRAGIQKGWQDERLLNFRAAAGAFGNPHPGAGRADCIFVHKAVA